MRLFRSKEAGDGNGLTRGSPDPVGSESMRRLGLNKGGYFGERLELQPFLASLLQRAEHKGWQPEILTIDQELKLCLLHRPALRQSAKNIYISAGIHGDEPAGPLAVQDMIDADAWPDSLNLWLWPCLNPTGFKDGRRENGRGMDLNRDYLRFQSAETRAHRDRLQRLPNFDLCVCLHEDWESDGFYLYELNPDQLASPAQEIIRNVAAVCPIDQASEIEGRPATAGIIQPNVDPKTRSDWPEAFYLIQAKTRLSYTMEAPSDYPLTTRVAALTISVNTALRFLYKT